MKRIIFHSPVPIESNGNSGSHIRPFEMLKAFQEEGYTVDVIAGHGRERYLALKGIKKKMKEGIRYDFLYSETSTMPMFLTETHHFPTYSFVELFLFRLCRKNNIPVTFYYRDIHWKYDLFMKGTSLFKKIVSKIFYRLELLLLKNYGSIAFLPSLEMRDEIAMFADTKQVFELPPGVPKKELIFKKSTSHFTILYVGGITPPLYDLKKNFHELSLSSSVTLNIVCRKEEWEHMKTQIPMGPNVRVIHTSGKGLEEEYLKANLALVTLGSHPYHRFSMPVKLFEAIGFTTPVVVLSCMKACSRLVNEFDLGYVIDSGEELKDIISEVRDDPSSYEKKVLNTESFQKNNSWKARAEFVAMKVQEWEDG